MLSSLEFLIHSDANQQNKRKLKYLELLYLINRNRPVRDANGIPLSIKDLTADLEKRLINLKLNEFRPAIMEVLDKLKLRDNALLYFVLVSTFRLDDKSFESSLKEIATQQRLMVRIEGEYKHLLYSNPIECNNIPRLPWNIRRILNTLEVAQSDKPLPPSDLSCIEPVDEWGLISREFRSILKCEELWLSAREGQALEFFHLDSSAFFRNLLDMHRGKSSDLFQLDGDGHFYQSRHCRVEEWNLTTTRTVLNKHIFLANQLSDTVRKLKNLFVTGTDNSIRIIMQKYLLNEQQIFSEYIESQLAGGSSDLQFQSIIEKFDTLDIQNSSANRFDVCNEIYEIVSAHYHVIRETNEIVRNINDYSPILLNDMSFIGSQSAPQFYSRRMWRRLNVALIQFIVNKLAEMLTTPDAELMELLTDAGDAKQMKNPSIWQRLNPLQMESSKCIDESLATRVADLIIGYQFFINDKKNRSQKLDGSFAKSNIQDAEELELFAKTPEFEKIIEGILSEVDINSMDDKQDELSCCINKLLENVPTTTLVEKYSQVVLEKSVRFFEFLKMFFTSAYIHLRNENIFSPSSLDTIKRERMQKQKYDAEFLKSVGYDMRSTVQDTLLTVTPTEPLNVFVSTAVTDIYSQVFTILNMLHIALDAVIETRNSDTLSREPRLRFAFFHMNTTVFAIRKNMLSLIEASYETLMKTLDFKKSSETRSSYELLNVCYRAHRRFIRDVAGALMLTSKRGTTGRVIRLMVSSVSQASKACVNGDAVGAEKHYHQFQTNLLIFLDQCRLDHIRYPLYRSLEIGNDEADGRRSLSSSYSDDLSCRSY